VHHYQKSNNKYYRQWHCRLTTENNNDNHIVPHVLYPPNTCYLYYTVIPAACTLLTLCPRSLGRSPTLGTAFPQSPSDTSAASRLIGHQKPSGPFGAKISITKRRASRGFVNGQVVTRQGISLTHAAQEWLWGCV